MGSIYRRGNRYWIRYRDGKTGRLVRKSAGTTRLTALRMLRREEGVESSPGISLDLLVENYLTALRVRAKRKSVQGARSCAGILLECFGTQDATSLSEADLNRFILARQQQGVKPKTINGDLITLRAVLNHAVRNRLLESLPVQVRLLKAPRKRVLPILQPEDIRSLLKHAGEPYYGILLISAHTGFRLDETLHLTWSDVLWKEGKLAITGKDGWESKSYQERAVYVSRDVLTYLKRARMRSRFKGAQDYVFSTRNQTPVSVYNACRGVRKVFERAGLYQKGMPLTHWIRHSVASRLLGEGCDVETVRLQLGHADASTTLLYAQSSDARMKSAAEKLRW